MSQLVNLKPTNLPGSVGEKPVLHKIGESGGAAVGSLVLVSDEPFNAFFEYMTAHKDYKLLCDNTQRYTGFNVWWGSYTKTKGTPTELYDALDLMHNGWGEGMADKIGGAIALGEAAMKAAGLLKKQYFVSFSLAKTVLPRQDDYMVRLLGPVPQTTLGEAAASLCKLHGKGAFKGKSDAKGAVLDAIDLVLNSIG